MANFLDENGVLYLWSKIKALFNKGIINLSVSGKVITFTKGDGTTGTITTQDTNTTYNVVSKTANGLAPKLPDETTTTKYLRQDGSWAVPPDNDTTYGVATTSTDGLMSSTDKGRVDNLYKHIAGYASTAGSRGAYSATIDGVELTQGTVILVRLNVANSANATINVNGLGAKPIYYKASPVKDNCMPASSVMLMVYDKTQVSSGAWHLLYCYDSNTTYSNVKGATASAAGTAGLVPAPAAGNQNMFLAGDGTWKSAGPESVALEYDDDGSTTVTVTTVDGAGKSANVSYSAAGAGPMSAAERTKLAGFSNASSYALKSDITNMYKYKGSVTDATKLPTSGQTTGDVYNIEAASSYGGAGMNVAWNGTAWDPLGEIFTITAITNAQIDTICV